MNIVNATIGKVGSYFVGPKQHLNKNIRLGEISICIGRDTVSSINHPYVWLIGGADQLIDYIALARSKGELDTVSSDLLLSKIDEAKKKIPKTAHERLASILSMEATDLKELIAIAQVSVTAPVEGVNDYSDIKPKWDAKTVSYAPIH